MSEARPILQIELASNTADLDLDSNIRSALARNLPQIGIGAIKDQPLIFCGSGPSLDTYFPAVRHMYPNAPVMAVNGAYAHLIEKHGEKPDFYAQLDARDCNTNFLRTRSDNTTFLLASQVHPNIFDLVPADRTVLFHLNAPSAKKVFPDAGLYFGSGGGTIGTTALCLAAVLGYRHICLLGMDSSYSEGKSHAADQPQNSCYGTIPIYLDDKEYQTTAMMAKQVEQFRPYIIAITKHFPDLDVRMFGSGLLYDYLMYGQTHERTRESEAMQYSAMYEDPNYGMSDYRKAEVTKLLGGGTGGLLDVGTGRGETIEIAGAAGYFPVHGTETVPALCNDKVRMALLPHLPFADRSYDTVTCFEVLEHLLPEDVLPALEELARVAINRVIVSVCTSPDIRAGIDLHPSARSEDAWLEAMKVAWGDEAKIEKVGNFSYLGVSPVFILTKP